MLKNSINETIEIQYSLCKKLLSDLHNKHVSEKINILRSLSPVEQFFIEYEDLKEYVSKLSPEKQFVIFAVISIGQYHLFDCYETLEFPKIEKLNNLISTLLEVENFFDTMGGLIGYQKNLLLLLLTKKEDPDLESTTEESSLPPIIDIRTLNLEIREAIKIGIEHLPHIGEICPLGGAGDRLNLCDPDSEISLPAALLPFLGRNLFTNLIRDIEGRECLFYKLFHTSFCTPIALMTSQEKNNTYYINHLCEQEKWYHRGKGNFRLFEQSLVPVVSEQGEWLLQNEFELVLKPGGHGMIWKEASDKKIFSWFKSLGIDELLVRQINNPVAETDYGVLATLGYGIKQKKYFGVLGCDRLVNSAEGTNVLCKRKVKNHYEYGITNIEYTEFKKHNIEDCPVRDGEMYSKYPANTNILFVEIDAIQQALSRLPIPGLILNLKRNIKHFTTNNSCTELLAGRLESSMQNIADAFFIQSDKEITDSTQLDLKTFLTHHHRNKTIVVTKNCHRLDNPFFETPLGCYYELQKNYHELFKNDCKFEMDPFPTKSEFLNNGPSFIIDFHPALGPLWEIIGQKIQKGHLLKGAELILEISDLSIDSLIVSGSLIIEAKSVLGQRNSEGIITDGDYTGKCSLDHVRVCNKGIDRNKNNIYWSNNFERCECLKIVIHGNGEFYASNLTFEGNLTIEVPAGIKMRAIQENNRIIFEEEPIERPSWFWKYSFDAENKIQLEKVPSA